MNSSSFGRRFLAGLAALALLSLVATPSVASVATPATYSVSRHQTSIGANHEIRFKTPSGVDASTDTIVLSNYTDFTFGSLGVADVNLFHGSVTGLETTETVAVTPAAGVWGVSIAGTSITFTAPTDAAVGEIPANDFVVIRIGTSAVSGTNQITNPATAQLAQIVLGGTFGDSSLMGIPIVSADQVTVSATVSGQSGGGGGGGGDNVPPQLFDIQVINITSSTATVIWNTDESSDSAVQYGLDVSYASGTVSDPGFTLQHSINLIGLSPNTAYHFRVLSRDGAANQAMSGDLTFTTLGDTVPPNITNIQVVDITDTSARVIWDTNELADSQVDYGATVAYGSVQSDPGFVTQHSVLITGLTPNTLYHFFVTSGDQSANIATSTDGTFTTIGDVTPPTNILNFTAVGGDSVVQLSWQPPPDPDYAGVRIVRRTDGFPTGPFDGTLVYVGNDLATDDTQVTNGVTYFYGAFAFDGNNNFSSGALAQATPFALQAEATEPLCSNGADDDQDGKIDCADNQCSAFPVCQPPPQPTPENTNTLCSNGADDDQDGKIDCADLQCLALPVCQPQPPEPPVPPVPPVSQPTPGGQIVQIVPHFYGGGGTVELVLDANASFGALVGSSVVVSIPIAGLGVIPQQGFLVVGGPPGLMYNLAPSADGTAFVGSFVVSKGAGTVPVSIAMTFVGGGATVSNYALVVQPGGRVVEEGVLGKTDIGVPDAIVRLFVEQGDSWVLWNAAPFSQANPQLTNVQGGFAFVVPNGRYFAEVQKDGYMQAATPPRVITKNVFGETVGLIRVPPAPLDVVEPTSSVVGNVAALADNALDQAAFAATALRSFIQQPELQQAVENVISPVLLAIALVNIATALPLFNFLAYLQYLFTQPVLLFWRKKKKQWGTVYNSLTKAPVDLAIVRLFDATSRALLQSKVTDRGGRYSFLVKPGRYVLEAIKPGYVFPTQYLKDQEEDVDWADLYHGLALEIDEKSGVIAANIPLDPVEKVEAPRQVLLKRLLRRVQQDVAFLSLVIALGALIVSPSLQVAFFLLAQVGVYLLFRKIAVSTKAKEWGVVFDQETRKPLERVIVRILDKKFNKVLETQVTDANGKYGFFVRRNVYYVKAEKEGYESFTSPDIDLTTKEESLVDLNIALKEK